MLCLIFISFHNRGVLYAAPCITKIEDQSVCTFTFINILSHALLAGQVQDVAVCFSTMELGKLLHQYANMHVSRLIEHYRIWGFHSGGYEEYQLLGYDAM
jgi:hypothetical protein